MVDWNKYVGERLCGLQVHGSRKREIIEELASHYRELQSAILMTGSTEYESLQQMGLDQTDWRQLVLDIQQAEDDMNHRTKAVLIPGTINFLIYSLSSSALFLLSQRPTIHWAVLGALFMYHYQLVIILPLVGALGAFLSRKNDGTLRENLFAGVFPAFIMFCVMVFVLLPAIGFDHLLQSPLQFYWRVLGGFTYVAFLPALLLLIGALPASLLGRHDRIQNDRSSEQN